ncbi:MAG: FecR domain-containing protein [Patescibacteria group bacterium]
MFNLLRKKPGCAQTKVEEPKNRLEKLFLTVLGRLPELDQEAQENIKKRVLNHIVAEARLYENAEKLDRKIAKRERVISPSGVLDWLAAIAQALAQLPKVLPKVAWRERVRNHFAAWRRPVFLLFLRRAVAFTILFIVLIGTAGTAFVYEMQEARAEVARVAVESGVVKIREANQTFFRSIEEETTVRVGDTVRVEEDSTASMVFFDASEMWLTGGTEVAIAGFNLALRGMEKSGVQVALLAGSVETTVAKDANDPAFEIATSTGSVEAQNAKFSVKIDPETGATKVQTEEDIVAVKSIKSNEAVPLVAGETVVFASEKVLAAEVAAAEETELPQIGKLQTGTDIIQIRMFDALIAAQEGSSKTAQKIKNTTQEQLTLLLIECGMTDPGTDRIEVLELFLRNNYPEGPTRDVVSKHLARAATVEKILNYYFFDPAFLRGRPEFEILAASSYTPPGRLRNLFATLRAGQLAHREVQPIISELMEALTVELAGDLLGRETEQRVSELLSGMQAQPIYLPALQKLQPIIPSKARYLVDNKIVELVAGVSAYVGA